jgi:hypothetical protein
MHKERCKSIAETHITMHEDGDVMEEFSQDIDFEVGGNGHAHFGETSNAGACKNILVRPALE